MGEQWWRESCTREGVFAFYEMKFYETQLQTCL